MSMNGDKGSAKCTRRGSRESLEFTTAAALAVVVALGMASTVACGKISSIKANMTFKQANQAYQAQDYKKAVALYEETLQNDPNQVAAYFFLGNSYDNLYRPGVKTPANDEIMSKAIQNYTLGAERIPVDTPINAQLKSRSLQFLMATYGSDKLDDPVKAEPVIIHLIELDPTEPAAYFQLAKLYEDAGEYAAAEQVLLRAKQMKPTEPTVYTTLAGYYNRQGEFEKTIEALEERSQKEPNNPEALYTIATYYWDKAYRDVRVKESEKRTYVEKGIAAVDHALQIKADYIEALVYKNLLLRLQANIEKDPAKQQALIKQADTLRDKAEELRKRKATGVSD